MKVITTCQGACILVDDEDYGRLIQHKWFVNERGYAFRAAWNPNLKKRQTLRMHREIMGLQIGDGQEIDHINGNKLDNRRCNLRIATRVQNMRNRGLQKNNRSGFAGVQPHKGKWVANIRYRGEQIHLGTFLTVEEAVNARRFAEDHFRNDEVKNAIAS